jgi:PASTA domain
MTTANRDALDVDAFSRRVELACADLPDPIRQRLIADLNVHLRELDEHEDLQDLLGPPEDYARDLREAMNLPTTVGDPPSGPPAGHRGQPRWWQRRPSTRRQVAGLVTAAGVVALLVVVSLIAVAHSSRETPVAPATPAPTFVLTPPGVVVEIPNVVGLIEPTATAELRAAGYQVAVEFQSGGSVPSGIVISQQPQASTPLLSGSTITLEISSGP